MEWIATIAQDFDGPRVRALVLMGSHARGTAGPFSDVDLVRIMAGKEPPAAADGSYLRHGRLVVASSVTPAQVESWFTKPEVVVEVIAGIRAGQAVRDDGTFAALQARANAFRWDDALQAKANRWAGDRLVGWIEEVHKGLEGLRRGDTGRLLNARFGLSWGLSRVVAVQRGVLLSGDNAFYDEIAAEMAHHPQWLRLRWRAFGIEDETGSPPSLADQVRAGLQLYTLTAKLVERALQPESAQMVLETVGRIEANLLSL